MATIMEREPLYLALLAYVGHSPMDIADAQRLAAQLALPAHERDEETVATLAARLGLSRHALDEAAARYLPRRVA